MAHSYYTLPDILIGDRICESDERISDNTIISQTFDSFVISVAVDLELG